MKTICLNYHNLGYGRQIGINKVNPIIFNNHVKIIDDYIKNNPGAKVEITFDDAYDDIYEFSFNILNASQISKKSVFVISDYIGKENSWDFTFFLNEYKHLDEEKIKILSEADWEIGSHGKSHKSLELMSSKEARGELLESKDIIEQVTEKKVLAFAPPFGAISQRIYELCGESGYRSIYIQKSNVITETDGINLIQRNNIYSIDRNRHILKKLNFNRCEKRKGDFIGSFNNLTIFFKKIIKK